MKFIVDAQLPPAVAVWLRSRGHDAVHLDEIGMKAADDASVWDLAIQQDAVVISKDRGFPERYLSGQRPAPLIVWIRTGNMKRDDQVDHISRNWVRILTRLNTSVPIIEVR